MSRGKPEGRLEAPLVRRRLTVAPRTMPQHEPLQWEQAWVRLGAQVITDIAPQGELTRMALPRQIEAAIAPHTRELFEKNGLIRRGIGLAHAAAKIYLSECVPAGTHFAGRRATEAAFALPGGPLRRRCLAGAQSSLRLGWSEDGGAGSLGLLDRLHCVWLGDLLLNDWMREQVAADLALGAHLAPDTFAGVRVIAHQVMARSAHVLPDWTTHALGECAQCVPGGCWA